MGGLVNVQIESSGPLSGLFVLPLRGETWHLIRLVAMGNSRSSTSRHGVGEGQGYVYAPWWCWLIMWVEARAKPGVMST
ncbi:hypothetical protein ES332_A06G013700v1 [Gossypium tomentosum]|uniref:Uncharacterized protein n=1 Tax=Gossypium tomentosum TaxID=34277 RepID=A0A5D2Q126_GOSTO|nr:hypothetical protein ES332_A06G013700v1 [Gossypium tomentosum]